MLHRPVTNSRRPPRLPQRRPTTPRTRHRAHRSVCTPPAPPLGMQKASRAPSVFIVLTAVHRLARVSTTERARTMAHATPRRSPAPGRRGRDARGRQRAAVAHEECATRYIYSVQAMPTSSWKQAMCRYETRVRAYLEGMRRGGLSRECRGSRRAPSESHLARVRTYVSPMGNLDEDGRFEWTPEATAALARARA